MTVTIQRTELIGVGRTRLDFPPVPGWPITATTLATADTKGKVGGIHVADDGEITLGRRVAAVSVQYFCRPEMIIDADAMEAVRAMLAWDTGPFDPRADIRKLYEANGMPPPSFCDK